MASNSPSPAKDTPQPAARPGAGPALRSGTAARLAGVSAATLRIWEHRYGVVSPPKSANGQRSYSMDDVQRLRLIKRLTLEGHAIGSVATLSVDELAGLSSGTQASSAGARAVVVVGPALARKLEGRLRPYPTALFNDLGHAERELANPGPVDVLVVHAPSLQPALVDRVLALRAAMAASATVVIYAFGAESVAQALRAAGVEVRREPVTGKELAGLICAAPTGPAAQPQLASARQYSDAELATLAELPSEVLCECPRHLAEIVSMLVGFERYSDECASRSAADAALHRHLHEVTSAARTMFEHALTRVVVEEGLVLAPAPAHARL